jgi:glutamate/tyrosine decarboxylase-like PLP-dependent enzyme
MHENGLNPTAFPALRKFEVEVVQMTLNLFNAPPTAVGQSAERPHENREG